jgi:hypothetical protein
MNLPTKAPGHTLHLVLLNTLVVLALVVARFVEFLDWQAHLLLLETIIGMKKKLKR